MNKRGKLIVSLGVFAGLAGDQASAQQPGTAQDFAPFVADSFKVRAESDRGATADHQSCFNAPDNFTFMPETLTVNSISAVGKNLRCSISAPSQPYAVKTSGGLTVTIPVVHTVCVIAHAETGSGLGNIGKTAWNQCQLTGKWQQYVGQ
jgi:hypothetical protein